MTMPDAEKVTACEGALTCERVAPHLGWHSRLMPNGTFIEWTDEGRIKITEEDDQ